MRRKSHARCEAGEKPEIISKVYLSLFIPSDLVTYGEEAKNLLQDLQNRNERLFEITILIINVAKNNNRQRLENDVYATSGILRGKYNCALRRLDYQQEQGLMSSLALGLNQIEIQRGLTTSSTAIFVPFTTQELFMDGDDAVYYGLNALSNNIIRADRKRLSSPNGLILGMPGSGKSFAAKLEIVHVLLTMPRDNIIVTDPEGEYHPLVKHFGGEVIKLSFNSKTYINPMDINLDTDEEPLKLKSNFIMSLCELIIGGKDGLQPIEMSIIDRAVQDSYREYAANPIPENMPILEDVYNNLLKQSPQDVAQRIAAALSLYVTGSLNLFNHRTNIDIGNRFVCFDIKDLGNQLKKIGMLILQEQVWSRVTANRKAGVSTWYYVDEFHLLLKEPQTASYCVEIWKRFRKWGGIPTGITQNVKDLLASREIENILENSHFMLMFNQAAGDGAILAKHLGISSHQLGHVTQSQSGEGLIFYGNTIIPLVNRFPRDTLLYRMLTTRLSETVIQGNIE